MSIEQLLQANIAALEANTAALLAANGNKAAATTTTTTTAKAGAGKTNTAAKSGAGKTAAKTATGNEITKAAMQSKVNEVKEALGTAQARKVITDAGFAKLAEVSEDSYEAVYNAAVELLTPQELPGEELDGEEDL